MFTDLNVFKMAFAMASHAGQRQAVVARNIANADTPGYRARDIAPFDGAYRTTESEGMRANRAGHLGAAIVSPAWAEVTANMAVDPNGNSVSVELELMNSVEAKRQHDRALAIYKSSLNILRTSLGRA